VSTKSQCKGAEITWIWCDLIEEFNVDSKDECDQLNLAHETKTNKRQCLVSSVQVKDPWTRSSSVVTLWLDHLYLPHYKSPTALLAMYHLTGGISSLLHSVNLILLTVLLVHLILCISPNHSHHLRSHHLSLPQPFTPDLKIISFTNLLQIISSIVFWFLPDCLHGSLTCTELTRHWRLFASFSLQMANKGSKCGNVTFTAFGSHSVRVQTWQFLSKCTLYDSRWHFLLWNM